LRAHWLEAAATAGEALLRLSGRVAQEGGVGVTACGATASRSRVGWGAEVRARATKVRGAVSDELTVFSTRSY